MYLNSDDLLDVCSKMHKIDELLKGLAKTTIQFKFPPKLINILLDDILDHEQKDIFDRIILETSNFREKLFSVEMSDVSKIIKIPELELIKFLGRINETSFLSFRCDCGKPIIKKGLLLKAIENNVNFTYPRSRRFNLLVNVVAP